MTFADHWELNVGQAIGTAGLVFVFVLTLQRLFSSSSYRVQSRVRDCVCNHFPELSHAGSPPFRAAAFRFLDFRGCVDDCSKGRYLCVRMRLCVRACDCVCIRVCVTECAGWKGAHACVCVCV